MMSMDVIEQQVVQALERELGRSVTTADSLDRLGIESLRKAELASELAHRFGIRVDEELLDVDTVAELADYVRQRMPDA